MIFFKEGEAAVCVAKYFEIPEKEIERVTSSFKGVPYRQELITEKNGVKYINDTAATTPQSVILAIKKFKNAILIAGGQDKNLNYERLKKVIRKNVKHLILLPGTATDKLKPGLRYESVESMKEAVQKAKKLAKNGDIVLLSPGAASFNLFKNEFDRGDQFNKYVKEDF